MGSTFAMLNVTIFPALGLQAAKRGEVPRKQLEMVELASFQELIQDTKNIQSLLAVSHIGHTVLAHSLVHNN